MIIQDINDKYGLLGQELGEYPDILYINQSARKTINSEMPETFKTGDLVGYIFSKPIYVVHMQKDSIWFFHEHLKSAVKKFDDQVTLHDINEDFEIEITIPKSHIKRNGYPTGNQIEKKQIVKIPVQVLLHFKDLNK